MPVGDFVTTLVLLDRHRLWRSVGGTDLDGDVHRVVRDEAPAMLGLLGPSPGIRTQNQWMKSHVIGGDWQLNATKPQRCWGFLVRPLGFEPRTNGLRVHCSAIELETVGSNSVEVVSDPHTADSLG